MKSGAETGWDFSSRWFITANGSDRGKYIDLMIQKQKYIITKCIKYKQQKLFLKYSLLKLVQNT